MRAPAVEERTCLCGCALSINHLAPQARFVNGTHAKRFERASSREVRSPQGVTACTCGSEATDEDPERVLRCVFCGKPKVQPMAERLGAVNGYDDGLKDAVSLMEYEGVEDYRSHRAKRRGRSR